MYLYFIRKFAGGENINRSTKLISAVLIFTVMASFCSCNGSEKKSGREKADTMCFALYEAENDVIINAGYLIRDGGSFCFNASPNNIT